jgi:putative acetyltransferase
MTIRVSREEDLSQIFDIYSHSKLDELRFEEQKFSLVPIEEDSKRLNELMESDIYVFYNKQIIEGYGALYGNEIRALFVRPESRGKGIGKKLLEFLLSKIPSNAYLYVASTNHSAKNLYSTYGFNITDTFKTTYNQQPVVAQRMDRINNN